MTSDAFRALALGYPEVMEAPHFELASFRIRKKIFATLVEDQGLACLMLTPEDQDVFVAMGRPAVYPVPNKWGEKGATYVQLADVDDGLVADALAAAYQSKAGRTKK